MLGKTHGKQRPVIMGLRKADPAPLSDSGVLAMSFKTAKSVLFFIKHSELFNQKRAPECQDTSLIA